MTRHLRLRAGVSIAVLLVAGSAACRRPLDRAKFQQIELGMTEAEVTKIVGKPDTVTRMRSVVGPDEDMPPYGDGPAAQPPKQIMYAYVSGIQFAQIYFEDGRVFGVRYNNEFLKGDWMEGDTPPPPPPGDR